MPAHRTQLLAASVEKVKSNLQIFQRFFRFLLSFLCRRHEFLFLFFCLQFQIGQFELQIFKTRGFVRQLRRKSLFFRRSLLMQFVQQFFLFRQFGLQFRKFFFGCIHCFGCFRSLRRRFRWCVYFRFCFGGYFGSRRCFGCHCLGRR